MLKIIDEGRCIKIPLPKECGYSGYSVRCIYKFDKENKKYLLSMCLNRDDIDDDFRIDSQEIDSQYIPGNPEDITDYIKYMVNFACVHKYFDKYIQRFEYTYRCFDIGNDLSNNS